MLQFLWNDVLSIGLALKKIIGNLRSLSTLVFFFVHYFYIDQLTSWCQPDLRFDEGAFPESKSASLSQQGHFKKILKIYPSKHVFQFAGSKEKWNWLFHEGRAYEDFTNFELYWRSMINVIPLVLCQRLWNIFSPDLCNFQILLYNFVYIVKEQAVWHASRSPANKVPAQHNPLILIFCS